MGAREARDHLAALNPEQRAAASFGIGAGELAGRHPPLLIAAGAGTGKTTTLAHRVARLVLHGADPRRILLLTFTRRAAEDMTARVRSICTRALGRELDLEDAFIWAGTFHGIAARLLREFAPELGLSPDFGILDRADAQDLMDVVREEAGWARGDRRFPKKALCLEICSFAVNSGRPLGEVLARRFGWCAPFEAELRRLFRAYAEAKHRQALLDYDDLLLGWAQMLGCGDLAARLRERFPFVLVDEYQDTSPLQARILEGLAPEGRGLTVVGDELQAIYGFRAASVRNMLDFRRRFAPEARMLSLSLNYRSVTPVLELANALAAEAGESFGRRLVGGRDSAERPWEVPVADESAQARHVVERVLANREAGMHLREQAVLVRSAHHTGLLELELARRRIPYRKYGGLRMLEAAHVKDVLAFLRFAENPRDRMAGFRLLQLLPGIGPAFARRVLDRLEASGFDPEALALLPPPPAARRLWPELVALLRRLRREPDWPGELAAVRAFYEPLLRERYEEAEGRLADLDQLVLAAEASPSRRRFLADLALDPPIGSGLEAGRPVQDEDYLVLSTIHSAKGREWKAVFVLFVIDGWIPSDMATGSREEIEEERRLLYVAVTRARDQLRLLVPQRCHVHADPRLGDGYVRAAPSRFLTARVRACCDRWRPPALAGSGETAARADPAVLLDLAARLRDMWKT